MNRPERIRTIRAPGKACACFLAALAVLPAAGFPGGSDSDRRLYGAGGIRAQAVRQGDMGSCYFHSALAAIANSDPALLRGMIRENKDFSYTIRFSDGESEKAYPEDIYFAIAKGYERSDGLWVGALFRGYAQRLLRRTLIKIVDRTSLPALVRGVMRERIAGDDFALLAYDRAIRSVVDQQGNLDKAVLKAQLQNQLKPLKLAAEVEEFFLSMLDSAGMFESLATMIRENGELFGAYRAAGQGGLTEEVLRAFLGKEVLVIRPAEDPAALLAALNEAGGRPLVAGTREPVGNLRAIAALSTADETWYLPGHAYTVLKFSAQDQRVTLRNPWASHPGPDGIFEIPLAQFTRTFSMVVTVRP